MDDMTETTESTPRTGISRRTVVQGVAWAVPAITLLSATPAYAATGGTPVPVVESVILTGTRGAGGTKKNVGFTWNLKTNAAITGVVITTSQPTGFAIGSVTAPTSINGTATATFAGVNASSDTTVVPVFVITVSFATAQTATFAVTSASVPENGTTTFTVTASPTNPTV